MFLLIRMNVFHPGSSTRSKYVGLKIGGFSNSQGTWAHCWRTEIAAEEFSNIFNPDSKLIVCWSDKWIVQGILVDFLIWLNAWVVLFVALGHPASIKMLRHMDKIVTAFPQRRRTNFLAAADSLCLSHLSFFLAHQQLLTPTKLVTPAWLLLYLFETKISYTLISCSCLHTSEVVTS